MSDGKWVISPTGTYASGTYYGTYTGTFTGTFVWQEFRVDVLMSGTCFKVVPGIAEIEEVAEVFAQEGQWFVKTNEDNILVTDVELMPLRRNTQYKHPNSYVIYCDEFPHHHRAPDSINGNVSLLYQSCSSCRLFGLAIHNHYIFTLSFDENKIYRVDLNDGSVLSQIPGNISSYSISVIDDENVIVECQGNWIMINMVTGDSHICATVPYLERDPPHWAVIKDVLCIGQVGERTFYEPSPSYTKRWVDNFMFNIWTGEQLYGHTSSKWNADAYVTRFSSDVIINRDFFWVMQTTSENGGTWPEVVGPEPSRIYRMRTSPPPNDAVGELGAFEYSVTYANMYFNGVYGDLYIEDMAINPFNNMLYFIALYYSTSPNSTYCVVGIMSPENMSYSFVYTKLLDSNHTGEIYKFIPGQRELYVLLYNGATPSFTIYNVRNWEYITTVHSFTNISNYRNDGVSSVVDINNRLWYMGRGMIDDTSYLYALNLDTGLIDIEVETGIEEAWGDRYYYPLPMPYRQIIPYNDAILIFKHNTIQYEYQGRPYINDRCTQIYKVT